MMAEESTDLSVYQSVVRSYFIAVGFFQKNSSIWFFPKFLLTYLISCS